jgi:NAD(P)-dependent dehydrogenase (short-subunit alcohol dehydrogenase family)
MRSEAMCFAIDHREGSNVIDLSLEGKTAVVTGGSKGIGRAIAEALAGAGASVALAARGEEDLVRAAGEIEAQGGRAVPIVADVSDPDQAQSLIDRTAAEFGTIDILVNNAGAAPFISGFEETRLEGFEKYFRANFLSAVYCTRAAAPTLLSGRSGAVLNIASVAGFIATPGESYYGSAKAAMIHLTKTLALEWASSGIRVNALAPGWIDTAMNEALRENTEANRRILNSIPMGRWGRAEEIAAAALFLCSPAASFVTGTVLVADGGQMVSALTGF